MFSLHVTLPPNMLIFIKLHFLMSLYYSEQSPRRIHNRCNHWRLGASGKVYEILVA
jgi:hypothetical protein